MASEDQLRHTKRRQKRWWVLAVVLVIAGAGTLVTGLRAHEHPLAALAHPSPPRSAPLPASAFATLPTNPSVPHSAPTWLSIPAIGLRVAVSQLGLNSDGTVQVPTDFQEPGWFDLGPSPGQVGSAVILGHVDSYQGPAVFFQLGSLQAGDSVEVGLADGAVAHFVVTNMAEYSKTTFPDQEVYGSHGYAALQLVTCGGTFDYQTGHYLSNVVAYTSLVSITAPSSVGAGGTQSASAAGRGRNAT